MRVGEQSLYLAQLKGLSRSEANSRLRKWFDKFEIGSWWDKKVEELSKGMQQKVQFIVTVVHNPDLLIFDEPFSGFDPINVNLIKDEILALKDQGATIIFSTHNMASVEELCDHICLIDKSRKILEGEVTEIKAANRTNTYEIECRPREKAFSDILGGTHEIVREAADGPIVTALVRLKDPAGKEDLLQKVLQGADLIAFREVLPSINDIFIAKVRENEQLKSSAHE
jgi:ABC-2 type transport system ATP-binding protein